LPIVVVI